MENKWSPGKIAAVICGSIAGGVVLLTLLFFGIFFSVKSALNVLMDTKLPEKMQEEVREDFFGDHDQDPWDDGGFDFRDDDKPDFSKEEKEEPKEEAGDQNDRENEEDEKASEAEDWFKDWLKQWESENSADSEYYDFHNEIRNDLSYQIHIEEYTGQAQDNSHATSKITYPVVEAEDKAKAASANKAIQTELHAVDEYLNSVSEVMESGDELEFDGECYVTYMDERILSVVYWEEGWLNGKWQEACLISVNVDMENGIPLTNSQILEMDEAFAIDFRERSRKQNGDDQYLDLYSDQEVTELLNTDDSLIIFYTPLGMEVGVNHYGGWVTVTYKDYKKYLKKF